MQTKNVKNLYFIFIITFFIYSEFECFRLFKTSLLRNRLLNGNKAVNISNVVDKKGDQIILAKNKDIPAFVDQVILKHRKDKNNVFFILQPSNSNHFHGDIENSNVNAMAGGKKNSLSNVAINSGSASEIKILKKLNEIEKKIDSLKKI